MGLAIATAPAFATDGPTKQQAKYEIKFLTDMIDHHMMAVHMAMMCEESAVHPQLKDLCTRIRTTQMMEIEMMQGWLKSWYGIDYEPSIKMTGEMQKLMSMTGAEFEIDFLKMMIRHHFMAVMEGMKCEDNAYHTELKQLCQNIVTTQSAEIETMRNWLCQWYSVCNYGPKI
jgi:uncharacterized protein (DUF305 family)